MLQNNTMRYGTDRFSFRKRALLTTQKPWNTAGSTDVEGFEISGVQPADSQRKLLFQVDDKTYKFNGTTLVEYKKEINVDNVLADGNTVAELNAITTIPEWVGKEIYPIIALDCAPDAAIIPAIKIALKTRCNADQFSKEEESAEYTLAAEAGNKPRIIEIVPNITVTGRATCNVTVSLKNEGEWSAYMSVTDAKNQEAEAIKYKAVYSVTELEGADSARVDSVTIRYTTGGSAVSGDTAEIYTVMQDYEIGLQYAQATIRHQKLIDGEIHAYVSFANKPKTRSVISIGEGTGQLETYDLGLDGVKDTGINQNTLVVQVDGRAITNFSYNIETSQVTLTAESGAAITASYEYGNEVEEWLEMTKGACEPYKDTGLYSTRFTYTLSEADNNKTISVIKFVLYRPSGREEGVNLCTANGKKQIFVLPHEAKKETIECNAEWSYDDNSKILSIVAEAGTAVILSYDWVAESQQVDGIVCGWSIIP